MYNYEAYSCTSLAFMLYDYRLSDFQIFSKDKLVRC